MARKYSPGASKDVEREMRKFKRGTLRSGKGGKGRQGEKPQAGDRDRAFGGAARRKARSDQARQPLLEELTVFDGAKRRAQQKAPQDLIRYA
jgi:uncharacterized protein DUF6496